MIDIILTGATIALLVLFAPVIVMALVGASHMAIQVWKEVLP